MVQSIYSSKGVLGIDWLATGPQKSMSTRYRKEKSVALTGIELWSSLP